MRPFKPEGSATPAAHQLLPSGWKYAFDSYLLDPHARVLLRDGAPVELTRAQFALVHAIVARNGGYISKDELMKAVWHDQLVDESSVHKLVSSARRLLDPHHRREFIVNRPGVGYRFGPPIRAIEPEAPAVDIEALIAPHRIWIEGRAALETLHLERIVEARAAFEGLVASHPRHAIFHIGLANTCILQYEATRTDAERDSEARGLAVTHARRAVDRDPDLAEAWATQGFVLGLTGDLLEALSAFQRAMLIEPDNWLICARHAAISWGEERYRAARRTLTLYAQFAMAHWLVASVYVARGRPDAAERELERAEAIVASDTGDQARFTPVAIYMLMGLLRLARGEVEGARAAFRRELELERRGHLYARECCANTWYALGALALLLGDRDAARAAFLEAIDRVPRHPQAHAGLAILDGLASAAAAQLRTSTGLGHHAAGEPFEAEIARAALLKASGDEAGAVALLREALRHAPPGNAGWLIALDPLLRVWENPALWKPLLDDIGKRAG